MTDKKQVTITIVNNSRVSKAIQRSATVALTFILPIGIGIVAHSSAMQWAGFAFGLLMVASNAINFNKSNSFSTVDAAKARLDQMKANGEAE